MAITYPTKLDDGDVDNDVQMLPKITPVPVAVSAKWTLSNTTIDSNGYLDNSAVAAASYAERYIPGVLEGHLYKVTVVVAANDEPLVVTMGGISVGTIAATSPGTHVFYVRPTDGLPLKIATTAVSTTSSITSIVVQAVDPMNLDLLPDEVEAARNV